MVNDTLDIERCVWDTDYRRIVKRILNFRHDPAHRTANQNARSLGAVRAKPVHAPEAPRGT